MQPVYQQGRFWGRITQGVACLAGLCAFALTGRIADGGGGLADNRTEIV